MHSRMVSGFKVVGGGGRGRVVGLKVRARPCRHGNQDVISVAASCSVAPGDLGRGGVDGFTGMWIEIARPALLVMGGGGQLL